MDIAAKLDFSTCPIPLALLLERSSRPFCDFTMTNTLICHCADNISCCKTPWHAEEAFNWIERRDLQSYFNIGGHQDMSINELVPGASRLIKMPSPSFIQKSQMVVMTKRHKFAIYNSTILVILLNRKPLWLTAERKLVSNEPWKTKDETSGYDECSQP